MRLYTFVNFYLSSIQQGIQTAHILGEIVDRHKKGINKKRFMIEEFLSKHKTIICCNGGNAKSLIELHDFFFSEQNRFPWACFNEDGDSLNCAMTGIGIILPARIYEAKMHFGYLENGATVEMGYEYINGEYVERRYYEGEYEYNLIKKIKSALLAR